MLARLTFALFGYEGFTHETICSGKPLMPRYMFARLTFALVRFVSHVSQCNRAHAYPCFIAARPTVRPSDEPSDRPLYMHSLCGSSIMCASCLRFLLKLQNTSQETTNLPRHHASQRLRWLPTQFQQCRWFDESSVGQRCQQSMHCVWQPRGVGGVKAEKSRLLSRS